MSRPPKMDERSIARLVDGEMSPGARAEFERRVDAEARLRGAVETAREQARLISSTDPEPMCAPLDFSAAVLDRVRRMPSRDDLMRQSHDEEVEVEVVVFARKMIVAAAILFGLAVLFGLKMFEGSGSPQELQAEDDQMIKQIDELVRTRRHEMFATQERQRRKR